MSRYEQKAKKRFPALLIIFVIVISAVFVIFLYQKNKQEEVNMEIKEIDIPIEKNAQLIEEHAVLPIDEITERIDFEKSPNPIRIKESIEESVVKPKMPALEYSDDSFRKELKNVSEDLLHWFTDESLIRKYIMIMNDLSQNQLLYKHVSFLKMSQQIVVKTDEKGLYLGNESYHRYDRLADAIDTINVEKGLGLYLVFRPLFKQVYDGFAYPNEYSLEDMFMKASASVIKAPIIETRISLRKHSIMYKFVDKKLEALDAVDKQMLRMGPENTKKIQAKLRQLVEAISELNNS